MDINPRAKRAEMGYWVGRKYWKQGIATEAAKAMLEFGFKKLGLHSVIARYFDINPASGRVMEKCGMKYEGTLRSSDWNNQGICDASYYALLKSER